MKIFTGDQIKAADMYTIEHEPVGSVELMERASESIAQAICNRVGPEIPLLFFIGKGNNGGDGLAVARMLSNAGFSCKIMMLYPVEELSPDCRFNYERLPEQVVQIKDGDDLIIDSDYIIIDAVLGTGLQGDVKEPALWAIRFINSLHNDVYSIDIPSGMKTEFDNAGQNIVRADVTLTLEYPKLAMLLPEAGDYCGEIIVLPIGIHDDYLDYTITPYYYLDQDYVKRVLFPKRRKFSHKGDYGHALLICGQKGMTGAAILAASGALRSGCGLLTVHIPERESTAIHASVPSAILSLDKGESFTSLPWDMDKYSVIGIGCGIGTQEETSKALERMLRVTNDPIVFDADAINIIASNPYLKSLIPKGSVLTPHLGEFGRLTGGWSSEDEKINSALKLSSELEVILVLKGGHTMIFTPDGKVLINSTGTPGMAKAGSGDVLTGFITGLIARGYSPEDAAVVGVYIHGIAGEKAAEYYGEEGMNSSDIIDFLADALQEVR